MNIISAQCGDIMLYGIDPKTGKKILPKPKTKAYCPLCGEELIPKCGRIRIWHWAHKRNKSCNFHKESETDWHRFWKLTVPEEWCEVIIKKDNKIHIADIVNDKGKVFELQHSHISPQDIEERENFYKNMCWIFDCRKKTYEEYGKKVNFGNIFSVVRYRMKHPKMSIWYCKKPLYLDYGYGILHYVIEIKKEDMEFGYYTAIPMSMFEVLSKEFGYKLPKTIDLTNYEFEKFGFERTLHKYVDVYYTDTAFECREKIRITHYLNVDIILANSEINYKTALAGVIFLIEKLKALNLPLPKKIYYSDNHINIKYEKNAYKYKYSNVRDFILHIKDSIYNNVSISINYEDWHFDVGSI